MSITTFPYDFATKTRSTLTQYEGCVLSIYSREVQIMSDVWDTGTYALCWDAEKGQPVSVCLFIHGNNTPDTERAFGNVDATQAVRDDYLAYFFALNYETVRGKAVARSMEIKKGCTVKVVSGKTAKGIEGKVVAIIDGVYGMGYRASREPKLGIATSDRTVTAPGRNGTTYEKHVDVEWVWARNCQRTNPDPIDEIEVRDHAMALAEQAVRTNTLR